MKNKRKTLLVALIVAIILLGNLSMVFADDVLGTTVDIQQSATELNQGDMVNFNIRVNIPDGEDSISATDGYITYDPNFFSDYEVSDGMTKGVNGQFTSTKILSESGIVGTIKLKIAQNATGSSTINFRNVIASDGVGRTAAYNNDFTVTVINTEPDPDQPSVDGEWLDLTNSDIKLVKELHTSYLTNHLVVTDVNPTEAEGHDVWAYVSRENDFDITGVPTTITTDSTYSNFPAYEKVEVEDTGRLLVGGDANELYALKGDFYVTIFERKVNDGGVVENKVLIEGTKITKPAENELGDRVNYRFYDESNENGSHAVVRETTSINQKSIKLLIGKITDEALIDKIRDKKQDGYRELLEYVKTNPNKDITFDGAFDYSLRSGDPLGGGSNAWDRTLTTNRLGVKDRNYYYIHSMITNVDSTYRNFEDVDIYECKNTADGLQLTPVGDKYIEPTPEPTPVIDNTQAPVELPQTGEVIFIETMIVLLAVGGIVTFVLFMRNREVD